MSAPDAQTDHTPRDPVTVRRRTRAVVAGALCHGSAFAAVMTLLPLHAVEAFGYDGAEFARLLALRNTSIVVGVLLLGPLGERFGVRQLAAAALALSAGCVAGLLIVPEWAFLLLTALGSALFSTAFINLNQLTQLADPQQGRGNSRFRFATVVPALLVPWPVTQWYEQAPLILAGITLVELAGCWLVWRYPLPHRQTPWQGLGGEVAGAHRALHDTYRPCLANRGLLAFMGLQLAVMGLVVASPNAFLAIRLTEELGAAKEFFGATRAWGAAAALVGIAALSRLIDRWPLTRTLALLYGCSCLGIIAMGLTDSPHLTALAAVVGGLFHVSAIGPASIGVSRFAGKGSLTGAFSMHKVLMAGIMALVNLALAWCEPRLGITGSLVAAGLLGLLVTAGLGLVPAPPPLHEPEPDLAAGPDPGSQPAR